MGTSGYIERRAFVAGLFIFLLLAAFTSTSSNALEEGQKAPEITGITDGKGFVHIEWDLADDTSNLSGFRIYRRTGNGSLDPLELEGPSTRSYNDTDVSNGILYEYLIAALYGEDLEENRSATVSAVPGGPPSPPVNVNMDVSGPGLNITWDAPSEDGGFPITLYAVQRKSGNGSFENLGTRMPGIDFFVDQSVLEGESYTYRIIAINERGSSSPSTEIEIDIPFVPDPPSPPTELNIDSGEGFILLRFSAPMRDGGADIEGYRIFRMREGGANERISTLSSDTFEYNDTSVAEGMNYTYTVVAYNSAGTSDPSQPLTVKVNTDNGDGGDSDDDESDFGTRNAILLGGAIAIIIIAAAVIFYLKMTKNVDTEEIGDESPVDLRPEEEPPEEEDIRTGNV